MKISKVALFSLLAAICFSVNYANLDIKPEDNQDQSKVPHFTDKEIKPTLEAQELYNLATQILTSYTEKKQVKTELYNDFITKVPSFLKDTWQKKENPICLHEKEPDTLLSLVNKCFEIEKESGKKEHIFFCELCDFTGNTHKSVEDHIIQNHIKAEELTPDIKEQYIGSEELSESFLLELADLDDIFKPAALSLIVTDENLKKELKQIDLPLRELMYTRTDENGNSLFFYSYTFNKVPQKYIEQSAEEIAQAFNKLSKEKQAFVLAVWLSDELRIIETEISS